MATAASLSEELRSAFTLTQTGRRSWRAPYFTERRGVVFGGQMLGQAVVAAAATLPGKSVRTVQTMFAKAALLSEPVDIEVESMHSGRSIGSVTVSFVQNGRLCARALVLLDADDPDLVRHQIPAPEVPPPDPRRARPHWLAAPETIVVGDVDVADPTHVGPPPQQEWGRVPRTHRRE
ncbi:MAG: thioesterase family protein, partial [Actinomycetota bacterium]|nr:thioesterase family protein [Actinomycetota bacterium]